MAEQVKWIARLHASANNPGRRWLSRRGRDYTMGEWIIFRPVKLGQIINDGPGRRLGFDKDSAAIGARPGTEAVSRPGEV